MSAISHDRVINASCATVYEALTTAQGLSSWFTTQVKGSGRPDSDWILKFENQHSFDWKIVMMDEGKCVVWKCIDGPGNSPGTEAGFYLKATADNQCTLTINHQGWNKNDPKLERCVEIWRTLMQHLQQYCETGIVAPVYH
ncbi:SRPBCC domain-containing protein [Legionella lytica]|uniref:SRPBCC domain-containing protein n=1 Tax=Legionella lytica TaxID=96232 RepID=A0ABW8D5Z1_9GAMM